MIRFIDLQEQIYCDGTQTFAWYDTVTSQFLEFNCSNYWETWDDFEDDYYIEEGFGNIPGSWPIERFFRLFPKNW